MGGYDHCAVFECNHRLGRKEVESIGRDDITPKDITINAQVCGCHFVTGTLSRRNREHVDFIPTLNLPMLHRRPGKPT